MGFGIPNRPPPIYGFGVGLCLHFFALGLSKIGLDFVCSYGMGVGMFIFLPLDFDSISRDWGFSNNVFSFLASLLATVGYNCFELLSAYLILILYLILYLIY